MSEAQDKGDIGMSLGERIKEWRDTGVYRFFKAKTPEEIVTSLVDERKVGIAIKDRLYETAKVFSKIIERVTGLEAMIGEHAVPIKVAELQASVGSALRQLVHLTDDCSMRLAEMEKAQQNLAQKLNDEMARGLEHIRQKRELYTQIMTDPLTGLYSRRFFFTALPDMIKVAEKHGEPISILVFDVNNFKRVNDTYGHEAGDFTLKEISKVTREAMPKAYVLARLGGDEFGAIIPKAIEQQAYDVAERLRHAVKKHSLIYTVKDEKFEYDYDIKEVTIALGVKQHEPGESADGLYRGADAAFYVAHKQGKDRSVKYSEFEHYIKGMTVESAPVSRPDPIAKRPRSTDEK